MPPPLGAGGIMVLGLSVHSSIRRKPEIPSFHLYMGPLVHQTNCDRFAACPSVCQSIHLSVHPERFLGICLSTHGRNGLNVCMLMYLKHHQNWLVYCQGLFILALFWLNETGEIWGFWAFPGECMKEMAWNFACWCIWFVSVFKEELHYHNNTKSITNKRINHITFLLASLWAVIRQEVATPPDT